jgi:hypothetical protein
VQVELHWLDVPNVVPALCIVYWILLFLSSRWTAATSLETEAVGVPMGMMQKSVRLLFIAIHVCGTGISSNEHHLSKTVIKALMQASRYIHA